MDWFSDLTGFVEGDYESTRNRLRVEGQTLRSTVNNRSFHIGELHTPSLGDLRKLVGAGKARSTKPSIRTVYGDVRELHRDPEYAGSLFQVASQFNLLEMVDPSVTPEQGVTRYQWDKTQGPACAIAAGAATIYRNYFAPVAGGIGQTSYRQFDMLADLGGALGEKLERPVHELYVMQNGYALPSRNGLIAIGDYLSLCTEAERDRLRSLLRIGLHLDVEVTDGPLAAGPRVSQAFCSALPVAYGQHDSELWEPFAQLVLEASYEATLLAGILNSRRTGSITVSLTRVGGGAFGNSSRWIDHSISRAMSAIGADLDVRSIVRA